MSDPLRAFSTGHESQLVITSPEGRIDLSHVKGFMATQGATSLGWLGSFDNPGDERLIECLTERPRGRTDMYHYVMERDGNVSTYRYEHVSLSAVDNKVSFSAAYRRRV